MRQQGEASVEEILDSIKKVIARDNREGAIAARRRKSGETTTGLSEVDDTDEAEEILDLAQAELVEENGEDLASNIAEADDEDEDSPLITSRVSSSMQENFAALAMLSEPSAKPQIVRSNETSLEGLVREMLRPMLADWLDKNLPEMVEKLVKDEISRIARKRS